ncbi:sulfatase-like hydrolase/transferase [Marinomonas mediterranea]|uniref:sulfatase-like hydrolase/transferase n=1 Tax=Marinomonas mediterranea TaxID=119864 RepID=UPI002349A8BB|nr:sulfatase-like hydrolase/transferase [Marinomonas mediterranea]WCN10748.1 DUF3413 domain-containing protein [Marinomonas mediterranea]
MKKHALSRLQWAQSSLLFGLFYTLFIYAIGLSYLPFIQVNSALGATYLSFAFVGQIGLLCFLGVISSTLLVTLLKQKHLNIVILWGTGTLISILIFADTQVYQLYRFHLGGFVWSLVFGEGGSQVVSVSWVTQLLITSVISLIASVCAALLWLSIRLTTTKRLKHLRLGFYNFIVLSFLTANAMHAWYDAHGNTEIRAMTRHLPLYEPATAVRFMAKQGWIDPDTVSQRAPLAKEQGGQLNYPTEGYKIEADKKPNILFIAIDAWRGDMFNETVTPFTFSLTKQNDALYFKDHQSGGNVTKGGIFSLFYGLPGTYWNAFTAAQRPPVFIQSLQKANYETGIWSSGPIINPSFHRNVFSSIPNLATKTEGAAPYERDKTIVDNFVKLAKEAQSPFFSFLFFDAAHGYAPPEDYQPRFQPYWERVDHLALNEDFDPTPYRNRYRTALHFIDGQIKHIIDTLKETNKLDNTIVIITSDHGEEFNDTHKNYWGHGSNFSQNQTHVPLVILWPGKKHQVFNQRTSHYDIVPTIMTEALGIKAPMDSYSSGHSLFDNNDREWLLVHSYFNYGVIMKDRIITTFPTGQYEVTDLDLNKTAKEMPANITLAVLKEISRFYK